MRTATEDAISIRYMLHCLGCNIPSDKSCPIKIFNDNLSVAQNTQNPAADFSKKHVAISYHVTREAIAAGIIEPYWISGGFTSLKLLCTITQIRGVLYH